MEPESRPTWTLLPRALRRAFASPRSGRTIESPAAQALSARGPVIPLIITATFILVLALSGLVAAILVRSHMDALANTERRIQDFTDVLAEHATLIFGDVDRTLVAANSVRAQLVRDGHWGPSAGDRPHQALLDLRPGSSAATNLSWTDEHGDRLYSALSRTPEPLNVKTRPYFLAHRDDAALGIHVGVANFSAASNAYLIPVTRRFSLPDGSFGGVTAALVDPTYLATFYRSLTLRQRLFIRLQGRDGATFVREPARADLAGAEIATGPLLSVYLPKAPAGTFSAVSTADGIERIVSYKAIAKLPLVITVSVNRSDALADWYQDAIALLGFYVPLIGLIAAGAWLVIRQVRQRARRQLELDEAKERLAQAQKLQALGTLVGGIAHEVNNALLPIMTLGEILQEALPDGSFERDSATQIRQSAQQIEGLIKRVLAFSREEQASSSRLDLVGFVAHLLESLRADLPRNIELVERVEPGIGAVKAGKEKLTQVFTDLVTNAAHAIGAEPGRIEISASMSPNASSGARVGPANTGVDYVRLSVTDNGPGIPPIVRERLFEPFFTTKEAGSGVGLGLYTARRVVVELGGYLDVESEPGKGACFSIYLPRAAARGELLQPA